MRTLWFKSKSFGWGWTPVRWQGWAVTVGYVGLIALAASVFLGRTPGVAGWIGFFTTLGLATAGLICICWITGEKPAWRWGNRGK